MSVIGEHVDEPALQYGAMSERGRSMGALRSDLWVTAKWFGTFSVGLCAIAALRARRAGTELLPGDGWSFAGVVLPAFGLAVVTLVCLALLRPSIHRLWGALLAGWLFATFVIYVMTALISPGVFAERAIAALGIALALGAVIGPLFAFCVWLGLFAE